MRVVKSINRFAEFRLFTLIFTTTISIHSHAQEYTLTTTKENIISSRTLLDLPGLSGNSNAIIIATPLGNTKAANPHPTGAWYYSGKWNIFNCNHAPLIVGLTYKVQFFLKPGPHQFLHTVTKQNLGGNGSYINHPALDNNPTAQFDFFQNHAPDVRTNGLNLFEVKTGYSTDAGKWYITNIDGQQLFPGAAYNIVITSAGKGPEVPNKVNPDISITEPKKPVVKSNPDIFVKEPKKPVENPPVIGAPIDNTGFVTKKPTAPTYDFSNVRICIERERNYNLPPRPPVPPKPVIPKIKPNGDLEQVSTVTQPLSGYTDLMWTAGDVITVAFIPGADVFITNKIKHFVKEWETYANIKFSFTNTVSTADIIVGFEADNTSWSWLGRAVLVNPNDSKTMNFGWFDTQTEDSEFSRTIIHEFGHALGFIHEHQSPNAGIPWDTSKVYAFYTGEPNNWDTATINSNIFAKYSKTSTNSSAYDRFSIMHYPIEEELTKNDFSVPWNTALSPLDKTFVRQVYPFASIPPTVSGVLKTGDDCDEIEFTVEYNVVHPTEVEFILHPGRDHHNALVNWWKMIGVPIKGSQPVSALFLNTTKKILSNTIDRTKPMTFGKAKILGVHTGLPYTWGPWPAIVGGCRVKFVWRRDSCQ